MEFDNWYPIYKEILHDFSFSEEEDIASSHILNHLLIKHTHIISEKDLSDLIFGKEIYICGAGQNLDNSIEKHFDELQSNCIISADGATSGLLKAGLIPDIIVTDFDGNLSDQLLANEKKSIILAHAHGDNIATIKTIIPKIKGKVTGSIQTNPKNLSNVVNFGGFTDGDRSVFLAEHFNAKLIFLLGFEFKGPIGKYSLPETKNIDVKLKKLEWAQRLIRMLSKYSNIIFLR